MLTVNFGQQLYSVIPLHQLLLERVDFLQSWDFDGRWLVDLTKSFFTSPERKWYWLAQILGTTMNRHHQWRDSAHLLVINLSDRRWVGTYFSHGIRWSDPSKYCAQMCLCFGWWSLGTSWKIVCGVLGTALTRHGRWQNSAHLLSVHSPDSGWAGNLLLHRLLLKDSFPSVAVCDPAEKSLR